MNKLTAHGRRLIVLNYRNWRSVKKNSKKKKKNDANCRRANDCCGIFTIRRTRIIDSGACWIRRWSFALTARNKRSPTRLSISPKLSCHQSCWIKSHVDIKKILYSHSDCGGSDRKLRRPNRTKIAHSERSFCFCDRRTNDKHARRIVHVCGLTAEPYWIIIRTSYAIHRTVIERVVRTKFKKTHSRSLSNSKCGLVKFNIG